MGNLVFLTILDIYLKLCFNSFLTDLKKLGGFVCFTLLNFKTIQIKHRENVLPPACLHVRMDMSKDAGKLIPAVNMDLFPK